MNRSIVVFAALAALLVAACAGVEQQQSAEPKADRTYTTGSRIPTRDGSTSANIKSVDSKDAADDINARRGVLNQPKGM